MAKRLLKPVLIFVGSLSLVLGVIGIFLPVLPTTPLLLLSSFCYFRSSTKLYQWLLNNRFLGPYIKTYYEKKGIPKKTKIFVITILWISILTSTFLIIEPWFLRAMLLTIATLVTLFILKQKTIEIDR